MDCRKVDYLKKHFTITLFIKETGHRLNLPEVTIASACILYHRFILGVDDPNDFDLNVIGCTVLYLAGKAEESPCKLRDLINISYSIINKHKPPIEIAKKYWELRNSIVKCELLCLRVLKFQVTVDNPHKYMLHYSKSLEDWCNEQTWNLSQLPQTSWAILNDMFHTTLCLDETASRIAVAVLYFAVSCTGLKIPCVTAQKQWWKVFCPDLTEEDLHKIVGRILDFYDFETNKMLHVH